MIIFAMSLKECIISFTVSSGMILSNFFQRIFLTFTISSSNIISFLFYKIKAKTKSDNLPPIPPSFF
ncbi:MAG TPA: hypothetical protein DIU01_14005 [Flavobacterium sp.]|nr:hypothetical protein [Flavobacterium sp.]